LDWERLRKIRELYGLYIVEDAACAIGAEYDGEKVGNLADISVFSLHPRKFITTGEGGLITTNNSEWSDWMLSYKHFGMGVQYSRLSTSFDRIGTNYKLSNIQAAVGLVQMRHIHELLEKRRQIAQNYYEELRDLPGITIPDTTQHGKHSYQSCCVLAQDRDKVINHLAEKGIQSQIGTFALHMHKGFNENPNCHIQGRMSGSRYAFDHCLTLPMYYEMTDEEQKYVIEQLKELSFIFRGAYANYDN